MLPGCVSEIIQPASRRGVVEVNDRNGMLTAPDDVPRAVVVVAHDFRRPGDLAACCVIVETPQQPHRGGDLIVRPDGRAAIGRQFPFDKRQRLAALLVVAEETRGARKACLFQEQEQFGHKRTLWASWAPHGLADAHNAFGSPSANERDFGVVGAHRLSKRWLRPLPRMHPRGTYAGAGTRPCTTQACNVSGARSAPFGHTIVPSSGSSVTRAK